MRCDKRITVTLPAELARGVEMHSRLRGISKGDVVAAALVMFLRPDAYKRHRAQNHPPCSDRLTRWLVGFWNWRRDRQWRSMLNAGK